MGSKTSLESLSTLTSLAAAGCIALVACSPAASPPLLAVAVPTSAEAKPAPTTEITANTQTTCDLVCERAQIVPRPADGPDYHEKASANANTVIEAMHEDLLACYKKRVAVNPNAHGFITVDVIVGPDGNVRDVETTGGAVLGETTMSCLVQRVKRASFDPPHNGGTLRIHVPFSLRRVAPGDESF